MSHIYNKIFVDVTSENYWWGEYGIADKVSWEDIFTYEKVGDDFKKIDGLCICAKDYFRNSVEELKDDPEEMEFVDVMKEFIDGDKIRYHYYYDKIKDEDFFEVPFEAPRNEFGVKPCSIEVWHPNDRVDSRVIKESVIAYYIKFHQRKFESVQFKEITSVEKALKEYSEYCRLLDQGIKMVFSDEIVEKLMKKLGKSKEKVLEILNRSC